MMESYADTTSNDENLKNEMGRRLHEAIKKSKYTQESFAEACGITYPTLRSYILGKHFYRVDVLLKASKLLKVSPEYLLCQKDEEVEPVKKFAQETHLSDDASQCFLSLIAESSSSAYNDAQNVLKAISNMVENRDLLSAIGNYYWYIRNKNVAYATAFDVYEYRFLENEKKDAYRLEVSMERLLFYDILKSLEAETKRLENRNLKMNRKEKC